MIDRIWATLEIKLKEEVAGELLKEEETLRESMYGRIIFRNCKLSHFKQKRDDWLDAERGSGNKRRMFEDILGDNAGASKKKKRPPNFGKASLGQKN